MDLLTELGLLVAIIEGGSGNKGIVGICGGGASVYGISLQYIA